MPGMVKKKIQRYRNVSRSIAKVIEHERESLMKSNETFDIEEKELGIDSLLLAPATIGHLVLAMVNRTPQNGLI